MKKITLQQTTLSPSEIMELMTDAVPRDTYVDIECAGVLGNCKSWCKDGCSEGNKTGGACELSCVEGCSPACKNGCKDVKK